MKQAIREAIRLGRTRLEDQAHLDMLFKELPYDPNNFIYHRIQTCMGEYRLRYGTDSYIIDYQKKIK